MKHGHPFPMRDWRRPYERRGSLSQLNHGGERMRLAPLIIKFHVWLHPHLPVFDLINEVSNLPLLLQLHQTVNGNQRSLYRRKTLSFSALLTYCTYQRPLVLLTNALCPHHWASVYHRTQTRSPPQMKPTHVLQWRTLTCSNYKQENVSRYPKVYISFYMWLLLKLHKRKISPGQRCFQKRPCSVLGNRSILTTFKLYEAIWNTLMGSLVLIRLSSHNNINNDKSPGVHAHIRTVISPTRRSQHRVKQDKTGYIRQRFYCPL